MGIGYSVEPPHRCRNRRVARGRARRWRLGQQVGEIAIVSHSARPNGQPAITGAAAARMAENGHRSIYNGNLCPV
jgi:hypothetical protein